MSHRRSALLSEPPQIRRSPQPLRSSSVRRLHYSASVRPATGPPSPRAWTATMAARGGGLSRPRSETARWSRSQAAKGPARDAFHPQLLLQSPLSTQRSPPRGPPCSCDLAALLTLPPTRKLLPRLGSTAAAPYPLVFHRRSAPEVRSRTRWGPRPRRPRARGQRRDGEFAQIDWGGSFRGLIPGDENVGEMTMASGEAPPPPLRCYQNDRPKLLC